jgi:hypothetical protein
MNPADRVGLLVQGPQLAIVSIPYALAIGANPS